ncbi:MAG: MlaD family protein [Spirochaetia bacterium]|nr:MlaD family protein [Spirochaetia bacterium]
MKFQKDDIFTGLFIIIGTTLAFATLFLMLGYSLKENRTEYVVRMEKLAGVKKGTPIKVKNYTVGEVTEVIPIFGSDIYFKSIINVDSSLILYRGTKINITTQNVIGDTILEIFPSHEETNQLKPGETLFALNVVNLDQMVKQLSGLINNISQMVSIFGNVAGDSKNDIKFLLTNLNKSIMKVNNLLDSSQGEMLEIMRNIGSTAKTLDSFTKEVSKNPWKLLEKGQSNRSALP